MRNKNSAIKKTEVGEAGFTLMELVVSLGVSVIISIVIVIYCSNVVLQYKEQKQMLDSSAKTTYLLQVFNSIKNNPSVRVRTDNKAVEVANDTTSPTTRTVYYEFNEAVYKDVYEDSDYVNTVTLAEGFSVNFSLQSDVAYLKDILNIVITDLQGATWEREISLRDSDTVETY